MHNVTAGNWAIDFDERYIYADDERKTIVCSFSGSLENESVRADANLIVAAKELFAYAEYSICPRFVTDVYYRNQDHDESRCPWCIGRSEALAKARGEQDERK